MWRLALVVLQPASYSSRSFPRASCIARSPMQRNVPRAALHGNTMYTCVQQNHDVYSMHVHHGQPIVVGPVPRVSDRHYFTESSSCMAPAIDLGGRNVCISPARHEILFHKHMQSKRTLTSITRTYHVSVGISEILNL